MPDYILYTLNVQFITEALCPRCEGPLTKEPLLFLQASTGDKLGFLKSEHWVCHRCGYAKKVN